MVYTTSPPPSSSSSPLYKVSSPSGGAKRKQVKNACVNCQKACKKCDDQRPCSRCIKYGIEDGCVNSQRKERKRKTLSSHPDEDDEDEAVEEYTASNRNSSNPRAAANNPRIQLNFNSPTRKPTRSSPSSSPKMPVPVRLSARSGIRPFPKELLESLQHQEDIIDRASDHVCDHNDHSHSHSHNHAHMINAQVTEEFKTLAKICSDLHTVLSMDSHTYPQFSIHPVQPVQYPAVAVHPMQPSLNHYPMQYPVQHPYQTQFMAPRTGQMNPFAMSSSLNFKPEVPRPRSASPPPGMSHQHLLKPSSPIYTHVNTVPPPLPRDLMNRTPPEEQEQDNPVKFIINKY